MLWLIIAAYISSVTAYSRIDDAPRATSKAAAGAPGSAQLQVQMVGFEVNGAHVVGHIATLENPASRVSLALPPGGCGSRELVTVTSQTHRPRCKFAVNAGYFNVHNGACIGNVISHGTIIQTVPLSEGNVNFGIKNGMFHIGYIAPEEMPGFDMMVSGVVWLVRNGKNNVERGWGEANTTVQTSGDKYATNLASRTAVGWDKDGRMIVLQIDGSIAVGDNKRGMDMSMLADALIKHGAVEAINLDGGGSSAMAVDGVLVNNPSDMRPPSCDASGLYQCERAVSTALCIHEVEGEQAAMDYDALIMERQGSPVASVDAGPSPIMLLFGGALLFGLGSAIILLVRKFVPF
jgi:exopolysaccharide biosynthesis protein